MHAELDKAGRELKSLTNRHAQLRDELEHFHDRVTEVEERFLAGRPGPAVDEPMERELKRKMILSRSWREELNSAYKALLATTTELDEVVERIHECQGLIASHFAGG
jgi:uncharacterized coiled-coil DUF342 family protein